MKNEEPTMMKNWWKQLMGRSSNDTPQAPKPPQCPWPEPQLRDETLPAHEEDQPGAFSRWMQRRQVESYAETVVQTNKQITHTLEQLADNSRKQEDKLSLIVQNNERSLDSMSRNGKTLEQVLSELQRLNSATERLAAALEAVPKSSREQSEKLAAIEDQLQSEAQIDRALLTSMDTMGRNVASLTRFAETQQANREEFAKGLNQQIQPLIDVAKRQAKFNRISLVLTLIIAIALLVMLAFYMKDFFLR
jgi:chromosome segregation ATPase